MSEIIGFYDNAFFWEAEIESGNGLIIKNGDKKEFVSHKELKKVGINETSNRHGKDL